MACGDFNFSKDNQSCNSRKWCQLTETSLSEFNRPTFDIWSCELGHPSVKVVTKIIVDNKIDVNDIPTSYVCTYCQLGKSHKLTFPDSLSTYDKPLQLIATDLWGPSPINSDYEYNYYIFFVDAYSRYTLIYHLNQNSTHTE